VLPQLAAAEARQSQREAQRVELSRRASSEVRAFIFAFAFAHCMDA
jgi:hypothetical protein